MPQLVVRTFVRADVEEVFDLSLDLDVERVAGRRLGIEAVGGRTSGRIGLGERVRWQGRLHGLPLTHTSEVVVLERPGRFVDEMRQGLFAEYRHEHRFEVEGPRATIMTDRVTWRSPLGPLGRIADALLVRAELMRLLAARNAEIVRRAERRP